MAQQEAAVKPAEKESQLVVFRLAGETFGLDIAQVREIIRLQAITAVPQAPDFIEGVINLRGQIMAVIDLGKRFGLPPQEKTEASRIIVAEITEDMIGFIVDEVYEVLRIAESRIAPTPAVIESRVHADYIRGVGKVGNRVIVLLRAEKILSHSEILLAGEAAKV